MKGSGGFVAIWSLGRRPLVPSSSCLSRYFFATSAATKKEPPHPPPSSSSVSKGGDGDSSSKVKWKPPKKAAPTTILAPSGLKKPSFAKELCLSRFDTDVLTFPEVLGKERHETLHEMLGPIEKFFKEEVDSKGIDEKGEIPAKVLEGLKDLGLFGLQVPEEYGGLGVNATEYARINEIISLDGGIAVTLAAHQTIGYKGILMYGTESQKAQYLSRLASGELLAAFALTEPGSGSDAASVSTKAILSQDGQSWTLNGSKIWISNGGKADFFTVFARTADDIVSENSPKKMTAFLVERSFGGVSSGKAEDKLGIRGSNTAEVHFENVVVPMANVLGDVGDGFKIAVNILNSGRFSMGSAVASGLRVMMAQAAEYAINRKQFGRPLMDFGLIQEKFARVAMDIYAMEAMTYMTAGMLDGGEYENCAVESAVVKVYSSEAAWRDASELLQVFGGSGYMKDLPFERALRDSRILSIFEGTNEILRLFISLMCLQHAGKELKEQVRKMRNPFQNPTLAFKMAWKRRKDLKDSMPLVIGLHHFLHPTLEEGAQALEHCVYRLSYASEVLLERYGAKLTEPHAQMELARFADSVIDIYAMTAVLARASRAYCIGLPESGTEVQIADTFVAETSKRCTDRLSGLVAAEQATEICVDMKIKSIAKDIFRLKGYPCQHPLVKTYW